jgi:hypothetical protein
VADLAPLDAIRTTDDAKMALGQGSIYAQQAYAALDGIEGDTSGLRDMLDVDNAYAQGVYATLPDPITDDALYRTRLAVGKLQIALNAVADAAAIPPATWDIGAALTGLLHDTATTIGNTLNDLAAPVAKAANTLLQPIYWALGFVALVIILLVRNGATLGGLL